MYNEKNQLTEPTGTDDPRNSSAAATGAPPADVGVVVAGPMARSLAREGAENMDPSVEDIYWMTNFSKQAYVDYNAPYATYQLAYRTGYQGRAQYPGKTFAEAEPHLQREYEQADGNSTLTWDKARRATLDAWNRVDQALSGDPSPAGSQVKTP